MVQLWRSLSFDIKRFFPLNDAWKLCMISHVIYHFYYWITKNNRNFSRLNFVCCSEFIEVPFMNFVWFAFFPNGCNRVASGFAYRSVCSVQLQQRKFPWNSCLSIHVKESLSSKSPRICLIIIPGSSEITTWKVYRITWSLRLFYLAFSCYFTWTPPMHILPEYPK